MTSANFEVNSSVSLLDGEIIRQTVQFTAKQFQYKSIRQKLLVRNIILSVIKNPPHLAGRSAEGEIRTRDQGLMSPHFLTSKNHVAYMEMEV